MSNTSRQDDLLLSRPGEGAVTEIVGMSVQGLFIGTMREFSRAPGMGEPLTVRSRIVAALHAFRATVPARTA